jgi:hypothetical protein
MTPAAHEFDLALRPSAAATPAAAWFIVGADPAAWLAEVAGWGVPMADVRLYPVPASARTRQPCGALAICTGKPTVAAALPYAAMAGGRLFHPADATITPPVSAKELTAALRHDVVVFHPSAGLVGFAADDVLHVHDLLMAPPRRSADWSHADPGPPPLPRLLSVEAEPEATSLADLLAPGQDDIGSDADEALWSDDAEPEPAPAAVPPPPSQGSVRAFLRRLFGGSPAPPPRQPPPADSLAGKRDRELRRLLELLRDNPDAGLQRALPLRDIGTRGTAPPSASLGRHDVSFSLLGLSGGNKRGDAWSMADDLRQRLTAEYRAAANRELNLGRHRRAAYIFAHLLGDLAAAANALARGGHHREAAALYRDHLSNPRAAADCLVTGGLLAEAVPLYADLSQHELAGDLCRRLDRADEAADHYRRAVQLYRSRGDPVGAARLLETKLADPDAALTLLADAWPDSDKAATCLGEWFAMAGRLGRHEAASARTVALRDASLEWFRVAPLAETLAAAAGSYPNRAVRDRAADAARSVAGRRLNAADAVERAALVRAVVSLVPGDRLLARDGERFANPPSRRPTQPPLPLRGTPPVSRVFRLPADHVWRRIVPITDGFLALGTTATRCTLVRGRWDGRQQSVSVARDTTADARYALLGPDARGVAVLAALAGRPRPGFGDVRLPATDAFPTAMTAATPPFIGKAGLGLCLDGDGRTWSLLAFGRGSVTVSVYGDDGNLRSTHELAGVTEAELSPVPVPMAAGRGELFVAARRQLLRVGDGFRVTRIELPGEATSVVGSPWHTAVRMLVTFEDGWAMVRDGAARPMGSGLVRPAVTFTPDGPIVAVGRGTAHVYKPDGSGLATAFDVPVQEPLAVLPAGAGHVAAFDADGSVYVYRHATR